VTPQLAAWLGVSGLQAGASHQRGALRLHVLPFTDQATYDHLLWACDLNFVRGEDSCVRAQWAARPFIWQAYPQADDAHWDKVDALLGHYSQGLDDSAAHAVRGMWRHWNGMPDAHDVVACWAAWRAQQTAIERHAGAWCDRLSLAGSLTGKLVEFAENKLK
jgi:uncharacterized repeat protein (TIGR03837 family)